MTGKRILLAEDEISMRFLIIGYFTREEASVTAVDNGGDLLQLVASSSHFDLIVCDINLPKVSGEEVYHTLTALHVPTPVLFITGYDQPTLPAAMDILHKPFSEKTFLTAAHHALVGARAAG